MKIKIAILSLLVLAMSCSDSDDVKVIPPTPDVVLPQGGNADADASVQALYDKYDTYFMYDFTAEDLNWTMVSNGLYDTQYRHTPLNPDSVCNLLTAIQEAWLDFYPEELNRRYLPKYVYMAQTLESGSVSYSYVLEGFVTKWKAISARSLDNQIAVSNVSGEWATMEPDDRKAFMHGIQSVALNFYVTKKAILIPEAFYEKSLYEDGYLSAKEARAQGFIVNPATGKDWARNATQVSREEDVEAYLAGMAYYSEAEWETVCSVNDVTREKYEIILQVLKDAGVKVDEMRAFE